MLAACFYTVNVHCLSIRVVLYDLASRFLSLVHAVICDGHVRTGGERGDGRSTDGIIRARVWLSFVNGVQSNLLWKEMGSRKLVSRG